MSMGMDTNETAVAAPRRRRGFSSLARNGPAIASSIWIVLIIVGSFAAPLIAPHDPYQQNIDELFALPSPNHLLGTDTIGRDILSRLMYAGNHALLASLEAVVVAVVIGLPVGLAAGYFGGWIDGIAARITDVVMAIPGIIVLLAVAAAVGNNVDIAMVTLGVILSASFMRMARGAALEVRKELYIDASLVAGLGSARIIFRHVLPNTLAPLIILSSLTFATALLVQSGLSFIGLGPQPPTPDWGVMIYEASLNIDRAPWLMVPSGAVLILTILAFNGLGEALRDSSSVARPIVRTAGAPHRRRC